MLAVGALHGLPDENDHSSVRELKTVKSVKPAYDSRWPQKDRQTTETDEKEQTRRNKAAPVPSAAWSGHEAQSLPGVASVEKESMVGC